ncbi:DUF3742 family protein [Pseudomonas syringae]|uniref:DUF3742 domain-containing protein n=3 Tax=Pseudomonas syringae group TaxID=136849 RepID=A0A9X0H6R5_PSESX|nr:DUF3742 family protein [Pseudomonas syringae]AYL79940.1 DUF3742 family protein [Pseudomonas syringae pv. actinidiae str. Shaanxi_M228]KPX17828.1 Uncharacterized protein ALO73_04258 [Pseudomonas syringae pv. daphniphylli]KWS94378.1 hypothetical protein AL050_14140 [Pseudomonas syringae pv. daphniphylli]MBL3606245.1 DUF3742 family protein [Pseudomonas syringae pv. actinidiae]OSR73011.1 hypothetical protein BV327_02878 [Pseudomonas syringae pv. actinidiae]
MTTDANTDLSGAARFGHVLGRGLRRILNVERAFWSLFDRTGVPRVIITPVKWGARAAVIGTGAFFVAWGLLYVLAVVCFIAIAIGFVTNPDIERALRGSQLVHFDDEEDLTSSKVKRNGVDGFGNYIGGVRVD